MGFFDLLRKTDINGAVSAFRNQEGAMLIDVREPDEYRAGHIPGSINMPLSRLAEMAGGIGNKETQLYLYCLRGTRSRRGAAVLRSGGFCNVTSIGGIHAYRGPIEK